MSMFPGPGATIYRNEAGEPLGWDYPSDPDPYDAYDDAHGAFAADWEGDEDEDEAWDEDSREDFGWAGDPALCGE